MTVLTSPLARRFIPGDSGNERVCFFFFYFFCDALCHHDTNLRATLNLENIFQDEL